MKTAGMEPSIPCIPFSSAGDFLPVHCGQAEGRERQFKEPAVHSCTDFSAFQSAAETGAVTEHSTRGSAPVPSKLSPHGRVCCCQPAALAQPKPI